MEIYNVRIFISLTLFNFLFCQEIIDIKKITDKIIIDGNVTEEIWEEVKPLPLTMITPIFQGVKTEKTEIRICYDNQYLYLSGKFFDSSADQIQANSMIRDKDRGGDFFNILLDTYNDNENFVVFSTTPSGNRIDNELLNDAEGTFNDIVNYDWNAYWDVEVQQDNTGWFAEVRIPFTSLRYNITDGEVIFGFITHRLIARKNERHTFPKIEPNWALSHLKASQASKIRLKDFSDKRPLYVSPYFLTEIEKNKSAKANLGLDLKYGVSNNQNLDITINTDFAQAEVDEIQVNLTRFDLFFPEKRQFFQERASVFKFQTSSISSNRLFHSRRIGLSENGELLDVYAGLRFTGRSNGWDYGFLTMQTEGADSTDNQNHSAFRFRKQSFNDQSYIGGLVTSQINSEKQNELVLALDASINITGNHFLQTNFGYITGNQFDKNQLSDQSLLYLQYQNRNETGWGYSIEAERVGRKMNPGLGFIRRMESLAINQEILYGHFFKTSKTWRKLIISINNQSNFKLKSSDLESLTNSLEANFAFISGANLTLSVKRNYDHLNKKFILSEKVSIPIGYYTFYNSTIGYSMAESSNWRVNPSFTFGNFYDGNQIQVNITPIWNPSRFLEISASYNYNRIEFDKRSQVLRADIARLNILTALNSEISLTSLIQYDQLNDQVAANVRFRYNFNEGNDLFIVYNGSKSTIKKDEIEQSKLILKYTYTFRN